MNSFKNLLRSPESIILLYTALGLLLIHYVGDIHYYRNVSFRMWISEGETAEFKRLTFWTCVNIIFYLLIPSLIIRFVLKKKFWDFGFRPAEKGNNRIYFYFYALMLPLVIIASFTTAFQQKYPYYELANGEKLWPWFILWECLYFFQFFALEFFFRGFMVLGLKDLFGLRSVLIMTIPYCMIHFTKPMPEAIGSIFAGLALGYLSYHKKSVVPGAILHFSVALTMDMLALWQKGML